MPGFSGVAWCGQDQVVLRGDKDLLYLLTNLPTATGFLVLWLHINQIASVLVLNRHFPCHRKRCNLIKRLIDSQELYERQLHKQYARPVYTVTGSMVILLDVAF